MPASKLPTEEGELASECGGNGAACVVGDAVTLDAGPEGVDEQALATNPRAMTHRSIRAKGQ